MITKEQIIGIARDELTPIGWHEEHDKYIDGLDAFAERLVKLCNISHVSTQLCDCKDFTIKGKMVVCKKCGKEQNHTYTTKNEKIRQTKKNTILKIN